MSEAEDHLLLVSVLASGKEAIIGSWADRVRTDPDMSYARQRPDVVFQWGAEMIDALIESLRDDSLSPLDAHADRIAVTRRRQGFEIDEVIRSIFLLKESCHRTLLVDVPVRGPGSPQVYLLLDDCFRRMVWRFAGHYARGAREAMEDEKRRMEILLGTAGGVSGLLEFVAVLKKTADGVALSIRGAECAAYSIETGEGAIRLVVETNASEAGPRGLFRGQLPRGHPLVREALENRKPVTQVCTGTEDRLVGPEAESDAVGAVALLPVVTGTSVPAILVAVSPPGQTWIPPDQIKLAWGIVNTAAPAVTNARLHEETRRQLAESRSLRALMVPLLGKTGFTNMVSVVAAAARKVSDAAGVVVFLADEEGGLDPAFSSGEGDSIRDRLLSIISPMPPPEVMVFNHLGADKEDASGAVSSLLAVPLKCHGRELGAIVLVNRDGGFSEEVQRMCALFADYAALALEHEQLHEEHERIAVLEERQKLARDLHDSVTQSLYGVTMYAEAAARLLERGDSADAASTLRELRDTSLEALREMRLLIFELRPLALCEQGIATAIESRLSAVEARAGLETEFAHDGVGSLPRMLEECLYGIAREALNNVLKHANATRVSVRLQRLDDRLRLEIVDDGVGFDVEEGRTRGGLGLVSIDERSAKLGARVDVRSRPGEGSQVRVEVPLPWPNET